MIGRSIKNSRPITLHEVAAVLEARGKEGELGFEQTSALDHAKKFSKLSPEKAQELVEELCKLDKVKPEVAAKIADVLPKTEAQVHLLFSRERQTLSKDEAAAVLAVVARFA